MLATSATAKVTVGTSRVRPSDRPRAVAHTASRTPESTRTSQDIEDLLGAVLSHTGYGTARPGAAWRLCRQDLTRARPGRNGSGSQVDRAVDPGRRDDHADLLVERPRARAGVGREVAADGAVLAGERGTRRPASVRPGRGRGGRGGRRSSRRTPRRRRGGRGWRRRARRRRSRAAAGSTARSRAGPRSGARTPRAAARSRSDHSRNASSSSVHAASRSASAASRMANPSGSGRAAISPPSGSSRSHAVQRSR